MGGDHRKSAKSSKSRYAGLSCIVIQQTKTFGHKPSCVNAYILKKYEQKYEKTTSNAYFTRFVIVSFWMLINSAVMGELDQN